MTALTHPYPMYGLCKKDGVETSGLEVKIEDVTQVFDHTTYTLSDGTYVDTLTEHGTVHDGDTVKVSIIDWGVSYQTTANEGDPGLKHDFNRFTKDLIEDLVCEDINVKAAARYFSSGVTLEASFQVGSVKILGESLCLADSRFASVNSVHSEALVLADAESRVWTLYRTRTETLALADSLVRALSFERIEQLTLEDFVDPQLIVGLIKKTLQETLGLSDSRSSLVAKSIVEQLGLQDSFNRVWTAHLLKTELLTLADVFARVQNLHWLEVESLVLQDSVEKQKLTGIIKKTLTETLAFADAHPYLHSRKLLTENLTLTDIRSRVWILSRTYTETLGLKDIFGTNLYGPFYGKLTLLQLINDLDFKRLVASLELKEEA